MLGGPPDMNSPVRIIHVFGARDEYLSKWRALFPGWFIRRWTDVPRSSQYKTLYEHGGMATSADVEPLTAFHDFLSATMPTVVVNDRPMRGAKSSMPPYNTAWMYFPRPESSLLRDVGTHAEFQRAVSLSPDVNYLHSDFVKPYTSLPTAILFDHSRVAWTPVWVAQADVLFFIALVLLIVLVVVVIVAALILARLQQ